MQSYPTTVLPLPQLGTYADSYSPSGKRTKMDGKVNQDSRFHVTVVFKNVSFLFEDLEWRIFQSWVFHLLNNGTDWFTMELPGADGGLRTAQTVRFVDGQYQSKAVNEKWSVTAVLEFWQEGSPDA